MKKNLWFIVSSVAVVAGCGGGSGGGIIVPPPGGGRERPTFNITSTGSLQTVFLSGSDRRAAGSQIAEIRSVRYSNSSSDFVPSTSNDDGQEIRVRLDGYTLNTKQFPLTFNSASSVGYRFYPMEIARMYQEQANGSITPLTPDNSLAYTPPQPFDVKMRIFPGRVSSISLRLNDAIMSFNQSTSQVDFNTDLFVSTNYDPSVAAIASSFSDYMSFDISAMSAANRPETTLAEAATRIYYSGDGLAISTGMGDTSNFELLKPVQVLNGKVSVGPVIGPSGQQVTGSNLYILDDEDPNATKVTSVVGTWKEFGNIISSTTNIVAVAFPSSRETDDPTDMEEQQLVIYSTNGAGQITNMWQGQVFYNTAGDPTRGTFRLFPISTVDDAIPGGEQVTGIVTNLTLSNGVVYGGDWDVIGNAPGSWSFGTSGGFGVYRK